MDDTGLAITSHSKKGNNKAKTAAKHPRTRKNIQKTRYVFNQDAVSKPQYLNCFRPEDQDIERQFLGVSQMVYRCSSVPVIVTFPDPGSLQAKQIKPAHTVDTAKQMHLVIADAETQTQEETQQTETSGKRPAQLMEDAQLADVERPKKKTKMSLAKGVDLAE